MERHQADPGGPGANTQHAHTCAHTHLLDRYELFIFEVFAFTERMACLEARCCAYCTKPRGIPNCEEWCRAAWDTWPRWRHVCHLAGTEVSTTYRVAFLRYLPTHGQQSWRRS